MINKSFYRLAAPGIVLVLALLCPLQAWGWSPNLPTCSVFEHHSSLGGRTVLPAGPVELPHDESGYASGYRARSSLADAGDLSVTAYDCPQNTTAYGLTSQLRQRLRQTGYVEQFSCDGPDCGDPKGWVALLDLKASASADAFTYTLARQRGVAGDQHVAVYAADLDDRPRVIVYTLSANYSSIAKQSFDRGAVKHIYTSDQPLTTVYFASGSSRVLDSESQLAGVEKADADTANWVVVGHADSNGRESRNGALAWRRALAVGRLLSQKAGIAYDSIKIYAVGSLMSLASGDDARKPAANNRRVDVFRLKKKPVDPAKPQSQDADNRAQPETSDSGSR